MDTSVLLGMSGGIDSSMSVLILQKMGFSVTGVTFLLYEDQDDNRIHQIIDKFKIKHYYIDLRYEFKNILIRHFVDEYKAGHTPSPCVFCNEIIKFPALIKKADELGIWNIATGHYVRKDYYNHLFYIKKGRDEKKDQSYYLWRLTQKILQRTIFPMGEITKEKVKEMVVDTDLDFLKDKKESMGICFLKNNNYREFLKNQSASQNYEITGGDVINNQGQIIGRHQGYPFYTIGQKKGLELMTNEEYYISKIDADHNILYVDKKTNLNVTFIRLIDYYFQCQEDICSEKIRVKVRGFGLNPEGYGKIRIIDKNHAHVYLDHPAWAVAPGQPVVFYDKTRVIGGGICEK